MANSLKSAEFLIESRLADAARGDAGAYFDLGIAFSTGGGGVDVDLIQAHKWFNLAALGGNREGQQCRADVSEEMSRDEIAEAQRQARAWLDETARRPMMQRYAA
jgi:TPR repeat protein